jgi:hypothetical protein
MIDYSKGKIYAVKFNDDNNAIYIGSTTMDLQARFQRHKYDICCSLYKYVKSHYNGDWSKCNINLLNNVECSCRKELDTIEGNKLKEIANSNSYYIINKSIAGRTNKEYYQDNIAKYKKYYKDNAEIKKAYQKAYNAKLRKKSI